MNERLLELRESLGLSQQELGDRIGVSRFSISNYEAGKRNITGRIITDICREFNVNREWFEHGTGNKFVVLDKNVEFEDIWTNIRRSDSENADFIKRIVKAYWKLPPEKQAVIMELIDNIAEK